MNKEQETDDINYFDQMSGDGLQDIGQDAVGVAYLSMVQPGSTASITHTPGTWRNSSTNVNYGTSVEVVVLAFKTVWCERDSQPPYYTVGRYLPHGIDVHTERPKPGTRGFPKMTNPVTGNKVEELFIYATMAKDSPEAGVLYFSPTVGSMTTCKSWNAQLRSQRLPSGLIAPIHAFSWFLDVELVQNPAKPNNPNEKICKFVRFKRGDLLLKDWHVSNVAPQLAYAADNTQLLAAPEMSGEEVA